MIDVGQVIAGYSPCCLADPDFTSQNPVAALASNSLGSGTAKLLVALQLKTASKRVGDKTGK
jgi:hypothetical protein